MRYEWKRVQLYPQRSYYNTCFEACLGAELRTKLWELYGSE